MVKIKQYLVENLSLSIVDISKEIKHISNKEFNSEQDKDIFVNFNISSILFSSMLKNDLDEVSYSLYNLDYIKEMIVYLRKNKNKILYASNISYSEDKLYSPYLIQNTKFNNSSYSSSVKVSSKNIEATMNKIISTSIQAKSFIRIFNSFGLMVSVLGGKKSKLFNEIKSYDKNQLLSKNINDIIKNDIFASFNLEVLPDIDVEYKCICSYQKCVEIVQTLLKESKNDLFGSSNEISLSCPICGSKYDVEKKDL